MTADAASRVATRVPRVRLYTRLGQLRRNPLGVLDEIGDRHGGDLVRLDLGFSGPYLVARPDLVEAVWKRTPKRYQRQGMMWTAMQRLQGRDGIGAEGAGWQESRRLIQPLFTAKRVVGLLPGMVDAVNAAVDDLAARVGAGAVVDLDDEMMGITHRVLGRVFLGEVISMEEAATVGRGIATAFASMQARLAAPWVPERIPLPGDRRFHQAKREVDAILYRHVEEARDQPERSDVVSMLAHATGADGQPLDLHRARNDVIGLFTGGTETTAVCLTWTWIILNSQPDIAEAFTAEVDRVVGAGPVTPEHVPQLDYTGRMLNESLRLRPPAWMIPRTLVEPDELGGVHLPKGSTVILSPYLTHRLPDLWPEPNRFDPERFTAGASKTRHPYAFFPFGGGVHRCLGSYFFSIEAAAAMAAIASRFRIQLRTPDPTPTVQVALRPRQKVLVELTPRS